MSLKLLLICFAVLSFISCAEENTCEDACSNIGSLCAEDGQADESCVSDCEADSTQEELDCVTEAASCDAIQSCY